MLLLLFFFSRNARIKKSIKLFNAFFGVFKIKKTGYKNLLILYRLNKVFNSYIPILAFLLKANINYNDIIITGTVS